MLANAGDKVTVRVITAGDESALEEKINALFDSNPDMCLAHVEMKQVQYHGRMGQVDFGFAALVVLRLPKV